MRIVVLEDNLDRIRKMAEVVVEKFPGMKFESFPSTQQFIEHLERTGLSDVSVLSLDHDLVMMEDSEGNLIDPLTGVDAAVWLTQQPALCQVVIHTTNAHGGDRIEELLVQRGWQTHRVVPYGDLEWIERQWRAIVRECVVGNSPPTFAQIGLRILVADLACAIPPSQTIVRLFAAANKALSAKEELGFELVAVSFKEETVDFYASSDHPKSMPGGIIYQLIDHFGTLDPTPFSELSNQERDLGESGALQILTVEIPISPPQVAALVVFEWNDSRMLFSHLAQSVIADLRVLCQLTLGHALTQQPLANNPNREQLDERKSVRSGKRKLGPFSSPTD